jgi:PAS domain S-box-containing protein
MWVTSVAGDIIAANPYAIEHIGQHASWWASIVHPDDVEPMRYDSGIAGLVPEPYEAECRIKLIDGSFRRHRVRFTPACDDDGRPHRWIVIATAVGQYAEPPDEVRGRLGRSEPEGVDASWSEIVDDLADGLCTVDGEGRLTFVNRAASNMLGRPAQELVGVSVHAAMHASHGYTRPHSEDECPLRAAVQSSHTFDETVVRRNGSTFEATCSVAPLNVRGAIAGAVLTVRDMTEVRRAEVEARHDLKLESLGRLSAGLAHEINTPIQFVGDNTRFLADAYQDMLELLLVYRVCLAPSTGEVNWGERIRRAHEAELEADIEYLTAEIPTAISQSLEGVERVASLVRAMKSFSYKDSAEATYADLNEAVRTTLTVVRNEVKHVADVVLDLGELPSVRCHLGDLNQVFLNLLVNAADALAGKADRGEIRISSAVDGSAAVIRFADNGPGIPEDIQQSIFEPFFTTKGVGKGTGQGLALARAVLQKHGGSIEVRSAVGEGTEFILRLPLEGKRDVAA